MPTLKELYEGQSSWVFGTNYTSLKSDTETLVEQETSGIRIKSAVELNNPLVYGNESIRIANRTTKSVEDMKNSTGGESSDGGLLGKGISKLTGGKLNSISDVRNFANNKLGIPGNPIPTYVDGTGELQKGIEPDTMITLAKIRKDASGTELGKFLKQTGGGNFSTIGRNIIGEGISLVKDKVRDTLFGSPAGIGENSPTNGSYEYSSVNPYSSTISIAKNTEPVAENLQTLQTQAKEKIDDLKSKTLSGLQKNKKIDEKVEDKSTSDENTYSTSTQTFTSNESTETNLSIPSKESDDEKKQDNLNKLTSKLPLGEKAEDKSTSEDSTYKERIKQEEIDDREEGTFSRIDLSKIPGNNVNRTPKLFRTKGGPSDLGIPQNNSYDDEVGYVSTVPTINQLETLGLTSNNGDLVNLSGIPKDGKYSDGDFEFSKEDMEALDLIPFWISGLDSSAPVFFRTLITGLTETVSPSWSSGKFVGNPYNFYTYDGVERSTTFNLNLYCMNQTELMKNWERVTYLTSKVYPTIKDNLMNPPFIRFRLGDIYNNKIGFIESLSYTMPDNGNWETELNGSLLPKYIDVSITIKFVEIPGSELALYSYTKSEPARQAIKEELNQGTEESVSGAPVTGDTGGGEQQPVNVDNTGAVTDKAPEEPNSSQGSSKGVKNINTGKTEPTPQIKNDTQLDGQQMVTFDSEASTTFDERYKEIRKIVTDPKGAKNLARRYGNKNMYLLDLRKEKENVYYVKEEVNAKKGNYDREWAYYLYAHYGNTGRKVDLWGFMRWDKYQKEQKKSQSDALVSSDLPGGIY